MQWIIFSGTVFLLNRRLTCFSVWTKKGSHVKPDELRGGQRGSLTNPETKCNQQGWSDRKNAVMEGPRGGSHTLGRSLSWPRPIFTWAELVWWPRASRITHLWNVRGDLPFHTPQGTTEHQHTRPQPCMVISLSRTPGVPSECAVVWSPVLCPPRTRSVCLSFHLSSSPSFAFSCSFNLPSMGFMEPLGDFSIESDVQSKW